MKTAMLLVALFLIPLSIPACTPEQNTATLPPQPEGEEEERDEEKASSSGNTSLDIIETGPLLIEEPDKGNPNLSGHLRRLIEAYERGEAEEFARPRNIELIDGSVTVIIDCEDGKCEAVGKAALEVGATEVQAIEEMNWVGATVPITKLSTLAEAEGIRLIRLPIVAVEE